MLLRINSIFWLRDVFLAVSISPTVLLRWSALNDKTTQVCFLFGNDPYHIWSGRSFSVPTDPHHTHHNSRSLNTRARLAFNPNKGGRALNIPTSILSKYCQEGAFHYNLHSKCEQPSNPIAV
jgi:hypothetical protein